MQSLATKVDVLISDFSYFDLVSFLETWLDKSVSTQDLLIPTFHPPELKDRLSDRYRGFILYMKDNLTYIRRHDLELNRLEYIWIQFKLHNKRNVMYGVFYRTPSSDSVYNSFIEDSIGFAIDSTISDIVVTGDFNLNTRSFLCLVLKFHLRRFISISVFSFLMTAPGIIMLIKF